VKDWTFVSNQNNALDFRDVLDFIPLSCLFLFIYFVTRTCLEGRVVIIISTTQMRVAKPDLSCWNPLPSYHQMSLSLRLLEL
jgi:hypothetical protein